MTNDTIGVDISKVHLDAHRMSDGKCRRFANDKAGHRAFIGWLDGPDARIGYEPTGPYHRTFERRLAAAGCALVKVNPRQARRFAEATGKLAKTDRLDAAMLSRMGALLELEARPAHSPILSDLEDLSMAREAAREALRTATKNRAKNLTLPILKRHSAEQLRQIERQIAAIEAEIGACIKADPDLARRFDILVSIPGVSAITAFALLIDMPELGTLGSGQAASLAGLAPVARQSGRWTGRAFIRGGRANGRQALYMLALVAMRFNPDLKAKYDQLKAGGKASKVAITAIMRKLVLLANALLRDGRKWTPALP